jgi:hypothetical protein
MPLDLSTLQADIAPVMEEPRRGLDLSALQPDDPTQTETVGMEDGRILTTSPFLQGKEIEYLDKVQNKGENPNSYFAGVSLKPEETQSQWTEKILTRMKANPDNQWALKTRESIIRGIDAGMRNITAGITGAYRSDIIQMEKDAADDKTMNALNDFFGGDSEKLIAARKAQTQEYVAAADRLIAINQAKIKDLQQKAPNKTVFDLSGLPLTIAGAIGMTYATKSPVGAAALFGTIQKGSIINESLDAGKSEVEARTIGQEAFAPEAALELVGGKIFLKIAEQSGFVKRLVSGYINEGGQEALQTGAEAAVTNLNNVRNNTIGEVGTDMLYNFALGGIVGGPITAMFGGNPTELKSELEKEYNIPPEQSQVMAEKLIEHSDEFISSSKEIIDDAVNPILNEKKGESEAALVYKAAMDENVNVAQMVADIEAGVPVTEAIANNTVKPELNEGTKTRAAEAEALVDAAGKELPTDGKVIKARMNMLDRDIRAIDNQIEEVEKLITERNDSGKPNKRVEDRYEKLLNSRAALEDEYGLLQDAQTAFQKREAAGQAEQKQVSVKGETIIKSASAVAKARQQGVRAGLRKGRKLAKQDIKQAQTTVIKAINDSELLQADKAKFMATIKNADSTEKLIKALPAIESRIARVAEVGQRNLAMARLAKTFKRTAAKKGKNNKRKGNYTAEEQRQIDNLREIIEKIDPQTAAFIPVNTAGTPEARAENIAVQVAKGTATSRQIRELNNYIKDIAGEGTSKVKKAAERRAAKINGWKKNIVDLNAKPNIQRKNAAGSLKKLWTSFYQRYDSMADIISHGQPALYRALTFQDQIMKRKKGELKYRKKILDMAINAYGGNQYNVQAQLQQNLERHKLGTFVSNKNREDGKFGGKKMIQLEMSVAEAMDLEMKMRDPYAERILRSPEGNGFTDEMIKAARDLVKTDERHMKFIDDLMDFYASEYYQRHNNVYSKIEGVDLPYNPNYSPIKALDYKTPETMDEMLNPLFTGRASAGASSQKIRTDNIYEMELRDPFSVANQHVKAVEQYVALAEKLKDVLAIVESKDVKRVLTDAYGPEFVKNLGIHIRTLVGQELSFNISKDVEDFTNNLMGKIAYIRLAGKLVMVPKQASSFITSLADVPMMEWAKGIADFAKNPKKAVDTLMKSPVLQDRYNNMNISVDLDIIKQGKSIFDYIKPRNNALNALVLRAKNQPMKPIKMGDQAAVFLGGWPIYKYQTEKLNKSHEQALRAVEEWVNDTQQSTDATKLSLAQKNKLLRLTMIFTSAPVTMMQKEASLIRKFQRDKDYTALARGLIAVHFLPAALFSLVANSFGAFDDDDEGLDQATKKAARDAILGPYGSVIVAGNVGQSMLNGILSIDEDYGVKSGSATSIFIKDVDKATTGVKKAIKEMSKDDSDFIDAFKELDKLAIFIAQYKLGVPDIVVKNIPESYKAMAEGTADDDTKKYMQSIALASGQAPGQVGFKAKKEKAADGDKKKKAKKKKKKKKDD